MKRNFDDKIYRDWRRAVFIRDKGTCQMPKCTTKRYKIQVHHIRRWADSVYLRYLEDNGICLCKNCHTKVTGSEKFFIYLFMTIIANNKKKKL